MLSPDARHGSRQLRPDNGEVVFDWSVHKRHRVDMGKRYRGARTGGSSPPMWILPIRCLSAWVHVQYTCGWAASSRGACSHNDPASSSGPCTRLGAWRSTSKIVKGSGPLGRCISLVLGISTGSYRSSWLMRLRIVFGSYSAQSHPGMPCLAYEARLSRTRPET